MNKKMFTLPLLLTMVVLVMMFTPSIPNNKTEERVYVVGTVENSPEIKKQLECLAINIYREAGYEPYDGRVAVAQVTLNRVEHPGFPDNVCDVVYEKRHNRNTGRVVCQFSWYCDPVHRTRQVNVRMYEESVAIAQNVLLNGERVEGLEDALFYHATYVNPRWRLEKVERIGLHIFYKLPTQVARM